MSKRSTDVFALEATRTGISDLPVNPDPDHDANLSEAQLGDLVDLAWEHPDILSLKDLARCRRRMKNGDHVYIVRENSQIVIVCWASSTGKDGEEPEALGLHMVSDTPTVVIDESWSARNRDLAAAYRLLLSVVASDAARRNAALLVHCGPEQGVLREELERQGFRRKFQTTRYKIFSRFRRHWVSRYPENGLHSSRLVY